jgi:hypothetical protein
MVKYLLTKAQAYGSSEIIINMEPIAGGRISLDQHRPYIGGHDYPLCEMAEPSLCHFSKYETLMFTAKGGQY